MSFLGDRLYAVDSKKSVGGASLVTIDLATGQATTLAVLPNRIDAIAARPGGTAPTVLLPMAAAQRGPRVDVAKAFAGAST